MKRILYYISGHGFGHAVRSALVIRELYGRGFRSDIITSAPKSIFDCNLRGISFGYHFVKSDVGVCQRGSLEVDLTSTLVGWHDCLSREAEWMESQLLFCREVQPAAIISDIVPFAFPLARRAGIPSFLVATFTWDWILEHYKEENTAFVEIADRLRECYLMADHMIFSPLSFGLPPVEPHHFVSLIGKRSLASPKELRRRLDLDERPAFLVSFGGFGLEELSRLRLEEMDDFQFLFLSDKSQRKFNMITFSRDEVPHEDLVAVSRAVLTKPGYGISCEAILNKTPMIYTSRGRFAEYEPLVAELKKLLPMSYIPQEELLRGGLRSYLENPPDFSEDFPVTRGGGAVETAEIIDSLNH